MATVITHGFIGAALGNISPLRDMPPRFWVLSILCSILPDADVIGFHLGVRYGDLLGHRGFSHSLLFALLIGFVVAFAAFRDTPRFSKRWWTVVAYFFLVTASHGLVDAMTSGGYGIGFFIPFDDTRYFLPWRPIRVSAIRLGSFFSSPRTLTVLQSEFLWVWLPLFAATTGFGLYRRLFLRPQC